MTNPNLVDAARTLVSEVRCEHVDMGGKHRYSFMTYDGHAAIGALIHAMGDLPPDAVVVSRALLIKAAGVVEWASAQASPPGYHDDLAEALRQAAGMEAT